MFFWNNFKRTFNLINPVTKKRIERGGIRFTWCNNQSRKKRIYCRMDRCYLDYSIFFVKHPSTHYLDTIVPSSISNYSPIYIEIFSTDDNNDMMAKQKRMNPFKGKCIIVKR